MRLCSLLLARRDELHAVARHLVLEEATPQLLVHALRHLLPARARPPRRGPQERAPGVESHRADDAALLGDRPAGLEQVEERLAQLARNARVAAGHPAEVALLLLRARLLGDARDLL